MERTRTVKDYLDLLDEGTGLLLVGGQAVNLWAELYKKNEPAILALQPFTSRSPAVMQTFIGASNSSGYPGIGRSFLCPPKAE